MPNIKYVDELSTRIYDSIVRYSRNKKYNNEETLKIADVIEALKRNLALQIDEYNEKETGLGQPTCREDVDSFVELLIRHADDE